MWHEARKQEKKIRGMIVDYRKRADRRKEFYERIRADPTQFLQLHGRKYKINFDVADLTDESHMMKWQGQSDNLIDRFDVRAHLDYIPPVKPARDEKESEATLEERMINYERFRILAQNEFLGVSEDHFLKQLQLEEQFGVNAHNMDHDKNKKKNSQANAAIGFDYGGGEPATTTVPFSQTILNIESAANTNRYEEFSKDYSDDSDIDMDVAIDINKIGTQEAHELNNCGKRYGMMTNDFFSYLTKDEDEKQSMKALKEQEADKILGGGRKSRRERRSQREKRILGKPLSPPSYAAKEEKVKPNKDEFEDDEDDKSSRDNSRSPSPEKITYITSFGGEDELKPHPKISIKLNKPALKVPGTSRNAGSSYADKVKQNLDKFKRINEVEKDIRQDYRRRSRSVSRSRRSSRSRSRRRHNSSRSRSISRRRRYSSRSRSRSVSRRRRNYSSRSRSDSRRQTRSSRSYSKTSYTSTSRDRSRSPRRRRSIPKWKKSLSRRRSYSIDKKSSSRRRSTSRKRSRTPKKSVSRKRSISKKRSYSTSSSSTSSSSSSKSATSSPEKCLRERSLPRLKTKSLSREKHSSSSQTPIASSSEAAVPIKRYYGRKKDNDSSSSLSVESGSEGDEKNPAQENDASKLKTTNRSSEFKIGISRSTIGGPKTHNPREKLKKKMQLLLNKQYKADKKAETERIERQQQQQQERDEEMRELALKLRRKQRELRHRYGDNPDSKSESESDANISPSRKKRRSPSSSTSSSSSSSRSSSRNRSVRHKKTFQNISRSPVRYNRMSRSRSAGRNYSRRYTRSRSRDYRR